MPRERPTVIVVIAIINFVYGGLCSIGNLLTVGSTAIAAALPRDPQPASETPPNLFNTNWMYDQVPSLAPVNITLGFLGLALSILLIIAGLGLLKLQPWARWACLAFSGLTIVLSGGSLAYQLIVVRPAMMDYQEQMIAMTKGPVPPASFMSAMMTFGSIFSFIFAIAYPLTLLIVMLHPLVVAAFAAPDEASV